MSGQTDNLLGLLKPFGLEEDEAQVYLELLEKREATALGISRCIGMGRTRVYRILDKLMAKELVVEQLESSGFKFVANEPSKLELLLTKKEGEMAALRSSLPEVVNLLKTKADSGVPGSKVLFYRGQEGLSRVNWNLLQARGEILSYEVATADAYLPQAEAEKMRRELVERKIFTRTLTNKTSVGQFTKVKELMEKWCEIRHISESELSVQMDVFIYNEVVAIGNYLGEGDVFCVEMHNPQLAVMQRQIFELLWTGKKRIKN